MTELVKQNEVPEQLLKEGHSLIRLENDVQMSVAIQRPRNEDKILSDSLAELDRYPNLALDVIYTKPVGKNKDGEMTYAEGQGIRFAESLANRWANSSYGCEIGEETPEHALLVAVFLDYETNIRHVFTQRVSKFYKTYDGRIAQYPPDRFDLKLAAERSKLLREVINRSLPAGLRLAYEEKARTIIAGKKREVLKRYKDMGISLALVQKYIDKKVLGGKDIGILAGLYNAIQEKEVLLEDLFGRFGWKPTPTGKKEEPKKEEPSLKVKADPPKKEGEKRGYIEEGAMAPGPCPNHAGDIMTEKYCYQQCPTRSGCPVWD